MSTEIVKAGAERLPVQSMNDLAVLGDFIAKSGMFGAGSPAKGMVIATTCVQERMSLMDFKRTYHVSNSGEVMMRSDRMLGEFNARGGKVKWIEFSATRAAAEFSHGLNQSLLIEYTLDEAQKAGLVKAKSQWEKDSGAMCRARLISRAVRMLCPEAVCGCYTPEEVADFEPSSGSAPVEIDPVESAKRIEATVISQPPPVRMAQAPAPTQVVVVDNEPNPFLIQEQLANQDFSVCPIQGCAVTGKPWYQFEIEELLVALGTIHQDLLPQHKNAIKDALAKKGVL